MPLREWKAATADGSMNKLLVHHMRDPDEIAGGANGTAAIPEAKPKVEDPGKFILESDSDEDD